MTTPPELRPSTQVIHREKPSALHMLNLEESWISQSDPWTAVWTEASLDQVLQGLSMIVGTMETVSELTLPPPLHIPVLDQPDNMIDCTFDNTLTQTNR